MIDLFDEQKKNVFRRPIQCLKRDRNHFLQMLLKLYALLDIVRRRRPIQRIPRRFFALVSRLFERLVGHFAEHFQRIVKWALGLTRFSFRQSHFCLQIIKKRTFIFLSL